VDDSDQQPKRLRRRQSLQAFAGLWDQASKRTRSCGMKQCAFWKMNRNSNAIDKTVVIEFWWCEDNSEDNG
jgi:hypothetical protein